MAESEKRQVARAVGIVGAATLLSRVLGFVRDAVIAAFFGASMAADAFFVAFRIPNLMRRLLAEGSLSMAFVPVFNAIMEKEGRAEAYKFARSAFRILALILLFITVMGVLAAPFLVQVIAPGFADTPEKMGLTVLLTRITFPYVFFICLVALTMGMLNSLGHFAVPALSPVVLNVAMIASVWILASRLDPAVTALAIGVLGGGVLQLAMQLPVLWRRGFRFRAPAPWMHPGVRRVGKLMLPTVFGAAVYQVSIVIGTLLASFLESGSVSYLYYADRLVQFPLAIFGISAATAVLPTLSRQAASGRMEDLEDTFGEALRWMLFINLPAMVGLVVLAHPLVALLFQRGAFDAASVAGTATALVYYSVGLWAFACVRIVISVFYAMQDTRTPVIMGALSLGAAVLFSLLLMHPMSYGGLALATSLGSMVNFGLLSWVLSRKVPGLFSLKTLASAGLSLLNSGIMGVMVYLADRVVAANMGEGSAAMGVRVLVGMAVGMGIYTALSVMMKSPELAMALRWIRRRKK
ncbi:murein biosynthesis integral membrane protein MurJ [Desulfobotulus sp. H1]|uniref:Probable lipid II flippase MurJ n=1 Tax=Desulfobotulus pelophilus TaxID=2823377 RepID=A0ABT3N658_9BACT|nr:murein biosynthesis integral membrane protein MurJ [Desulfobotulus pelophilus]MCW7752947.1 murein biosynthesis integral membrane protein MurJ [Desulfobotulus pelophilus]